MKRTIFLTLLILVIASAVSLLHADEMYWDGTAADDEITDSDFKYKYGEPSTTKSLADLGIYDDNMVINVEGPDDVPVADYETAAPAPIQPRSSETSRTPAVEPARRDVAPRTTERERESGVNIMRRLERAPKSHPQSVEPQPGQPAAPPALGDKKMKWGQQESNSSDIKAKFQWGEKK